MRAAPTHPGQCVHEWEPVGRTTPGAWRTDACVHCGATCDRNRAGQIVAYDRAAGFDVRTDGRAVS